jgi:aminocarboxymuconate-semialdehyde decarboxylase
VAIDFHAHLAREDPEAPPFMRAMFDVDGYLERQEEAGIELTVLSYAPGELAGSPDELETAKAEHDFLAELIRAHPDRFKAFAGVDPHGGEGWLEEADRALEAGFTGFALPTSSQGRYLDMNGAQDALALAEERGVLVFLHPSTSPVPVERLGDSALSGWLGRPYDTGICLARMLLADTLAAYPGIRMIVAHSGGMLPMLLGRLDHVYSSFERRARFAALAGEGGPVPRPPGDEDPGEGALEASVEGDPPSRRIGQLWFDTASYHRASLLAAISTVGVERVVVGTDFPPAGDSPRPTLDLIEELELEPEQREMILSGNGRELL